MSSIINPNQKGAKGDTGSVGPKGDSGDNGQAGVRGSIWTVGSGVPSASANVGDMYLDTSTGNVWRMG